MAMAVTHNVEILVDLFLRDDPILNEKQSSSKAAFAPECCVVLEGHDGEPVPVDDQERLLRTKVARDFKYSGDEFLKKYTTAKKRSITDDVKDLFRTPIEKAGGEEKVFGRFKELMDSAVKDTALDDSAKVLAAVLVSVKGLSYLGGAVRNYTLRYIGERHLDRDLQKIQDGGHPSLD